MSTASEAIITAGRRLQILTALSLRPQFRADPRNLRQELEVTGYAMTLTKLAVECAFLADLGLVDAPAEGLIRLTDDGLSVVRGLVKLPGIGTPEPGAL
ncbi:MAG: hypothetical protein D3M94_07195 [Rhodocyclales bacterium GT-UBC]|nr:MAG: hypothetical protein D3M94_07195 [Rhodocyclales bacterium GT-UBC]